MKKDMINKMQFEEVLHELNIDKSLKMPKIEFAQLEQPS